MKKSHVLAACALGLFAVKSGPSKAGYEIYDSTVTSCTAINCGAIVIPGSLFVFGSDPTRWEAAVFARNGECLRLDETAVSAGDDEMVVVGPNGAFWRNDDFTGTRPRVAFVAPQDGWYYVTIGHFTGSAVDHNLTLRYGRYLGGAGNPNCATPTVPALSLQAGKAAAAKAQSTSAPNAPGH